MKIWQRSACIAAAIATALVSEPPKGAKKLSEITYDEMLELATLGAQVLNNRSVEMAKKYNVKARAT